MRPSINARIKAYQSGDHKAFNDVYNHVFPDFRVWYRHVQRYTDLDRATLLCEFQYIVLRAVRGFDPDCPVPDGFTRYFRAAAKKHALTLRRQQAGTIQCHSLRQDWEVIDPKGQTDSEYLEVIELIHTCFMGDERDLLLLRLAGEQADGIKDQLGLSEFQYRSSVRRIKSNLRLNKTLSRD